MIFLKSTVVFLISFLLTPIIIKIALTTGAVDIPNERKVHFKKIPRLGGLAIVLSFYFGLLLFTPKSSYLEGVIWGSFFIAITGIMDDLVTLSPKWKLIGQVLASFFVVTNGLYIKFMHIPFIGQVDIGWWGIPLTFIWIITVTNSMNLIDGLDGLAAGVSVIVLLTIIYLSLPGFNFVVQTSIILIVSILGFLYYNFHPAKVFMGDTGALFLGFMIAVLTLLEFKNVTLFSLLVPALMLGVPLSDTFFAIIRRLVNKKSISVADRSHLHHSILKLGFSHLQTVLIIYLISAIFSIAAIVFSRSTIWYSMFVIFFVLFFIELLGEMLELLGKDNKPLTKIFIKVSSLSWRKKEG
ncbi:MraY family glycosyltransferase [Bacillus sp. FJAT-47783]|uniref:glycosyltransferase family 4 protein n=1 Tax=Bacillus sp. FJAT-47783 TaxID=2922712 RepID=UPI001FADBFB8